MHNDITLISPTVIETIADAIRKGCYEHVAAQRAGIARQTLYLWKTKGERQVQQRAERAAQGLPTPDPPSEYERLYLALETAKAEARYDAETRVFRNQPLQWLRSGYARNDWRESDQLVRLIQDAVEAKLRSLLAAQELVANVQQQIASRRRVDEIAAAAAAPEEVRADLR